MNQLANASLSELRAVAHALCKEAWYKVAFTNCLGNLNEFNPGGPQAMNHAELIEQATAQELLQCQTKLCESRPVTRIRVYNHLEAFRYKKAVEHKKAVELVTKAAEPLDPIKNATAKDFHRVLLALCQEDGTMDRVETHLRVLRSSMPNALADPGWLISAATETELHAIGLAMCEVDEDVKKRVAESLRVIYIFEQR